MRTFWKRCAFILLIFLALFRFIELTAANSRPASGSKGWVQFPHNDHSPVYDPGEEITTNAQLALTAAGDQVAMTYTPATYLLKELDANTPIQLQIYDGLLDPAGIDTGNSEAVMELVFGTEELSTDWKVYCRSDEETQLIASQDSPRVSIDSSSPCSFKAGAWSGTLFIDTPSSDKLSFKTVWKGSSQLLNYSNKPSNYQNLINVFRFQARQGIVSLAPTNPHEIVSGTEEDWKQLQEKRHFEQSINWAVFYQLQANSMFSFEVDVEHHQGDFLYLWEKDADANSLFINKGKSTPANPPDDGIQLLVRWSDGKPLKYEQESSSVSGGIPISNNPEWTHFDQTNRNDFLPPWHTEGEQNAYDGPSWDTDKDSEGIDSIRWYKIPLQDRKSDKILVSWYGSSVQNNAFAFSASAPLSPSPCSSPQDCQQDFDAGDSIDDDFTPPDEETDDDEPPESEYKCSTQGVLQACLFSTPKADPALESFGLDPKDPQLNRIVYMLEVQHIGDEESILLQDVSFLFQNPLLTSIDPDSLTTYNGQLINGKGSLSSQLAEELEPGEIISFSFSVQLDEIDEDDYDISTAEKFRISSASYEDMILPPLVHHVGRGSNLIETERCYDFDTQDGNFNCEQSCPLVAPGTIVTVRDRVKNVGQGLLKKYSYLIPPLHEDFLFLDNSLRLDDFRHGKPIASDVSEPLIFETPLLPNHYRDVYFQYLLPDDILTNENEPDEPKCFEHTLQPPTLSHVADCQNSSIESPPGSICVSPDPPARIEATLSSVPLEGELLYPESIVRYQLEIRNLSDQAIEEISISPAQVQQSSCQQSECQGTTLHSPPELAEQYGTLHISYSIRINKNTQGSEIFNPGHSVQFKGFDGDLQSIESNSLSHPLSSFPEPQGEFQHHLHLHRKTALNTADESKKRDDQADQIPVQYSFSFSGTQQRIVLPEIQGSRNYLHNVCSIIFPSYEFYDASFNAYTYAYNSEKPQLNRSHFEDITSADLSFEVVTDSPETRPEFVTEEGEHQSRFRFTFSGNTSAQWSVNRFLQQGGTVPSQNLPTTTLFAKKDGTAGIVSSSNEAITPFGKKEVREDLWQYVQTDQRRDRNRCLRCTTKRCYYYDAIVPIYEWKVVSDKPIPLFNQDQEYIHALNSVAWLQTKNGHLGTGSSPWFEDPQLGDPNFVQLEDGTISDLMKWYTPPDEQHADLIVSSPGNGTPLLSNLGIELNNQYIDEGFLETANGENQLSRGESYDREWFPRDYFDDLIHREYYGPVVHLDDLNPLPQGFFRSLSGIQLEGNVSLEAHTIYYTQGALTIGRNTQTDTIIDGGRARIVSEGPIEIRSNVSYAHQNTSDLSSVPSLRIHSLQDISISPEVTEVELMMLAEGTFYSGSSDQQLRILGDVIAHTAAWQRSPLRGGREEDELVNKPSELIVEDFRKVVVPPPGDLQLADTGNIWRELKPNEGKGYLDDLLNRTTFGN